MQCPIDVQKVYLHEFLTSTSDDKFRPLTLEHSLDRKLRGPTAVKGAVEKELAGSRYQTVRFSTNKFTQSKSFYYQLMHKKIVFKGILKFTLKQLQHVSLWSPSSGRVLCELAKVTVLNQLVKIRQCGTYITLHIPPFSLFIYHASFVVLNFFFLSWQDSPPLGHGLSIVEDSRSYSDTPHSVGPLWTSEQANAETCTWQHTTLTRDRHQCPRRDSNPQSQQTSARRPTSWAV